MAETVAKNAAMIIHRSPNIWRDETEINGRRHQQNISEAQPKHPQRRDKEPDSLASAAQLPRAGPVNGLAISHAHQINLVTPYFKYLSIGG